MFTGYNTSVHFLKHSAAYIFMPSFSQHLVRYYGLEQSIVDRAVT